jgi:hypothetical protein
MGEARQGVVLEQARAISAWNDLTRPIHRGTPGDKVYIPFDPEAANLMSSPRLRPLRAREHDRHLEQAVLGLGGDRRRRGGRAAMIDRLVHHAEILSLKGDSYRLRDKDLGSPPRGD